MLRNSLTLALALSIIVIPAAGLASDNFLSRALTAPHESGRWINRSLTIRHQGQDSPQVKVAAHKDSFLSRMATEPHGRGRWVNRRLTFRHKD